jgi:ribonuclease VapC
MIVVDTSALIAIIKAERDAPDFVKAIVEQAPALISQVSVFEATLVASSSLDRLAIDVVDDYVGRLGLEIRTVEGSQTLAARRGFLDFGTGRHPASLNFGDCFAYGLAKSLNLPLLYKGSDFGKTDISTVTISSPSAGGP